MLSRRSTFLWLVIGLFIQQRELADNTEVLRQTSIQSEKQTQAIAATEMNARQETFFKIAENVKSQLGGITGMSISCMGATEGQLVPKERISEMWHMLAWKMATIPVEDLTARAAAIVAAVGSSKLEVAKTEATPGGGTLPGVVIPSAGVKTKGDFTASLRHRPMPIIARVEDNETVVDLRTVDPSRDQLLITALGEVL